MQVEHSAALFACRRILAKLITTFDFAKKTLDENKLKEFKRILKLNAEIIPTVFDDFLKHLRQNNSERRLAVLFLSKELFDRSHIFRVQLINSVQDFLLYTAETDPLHHALPPPKEAANTLKVETLKLVKIWHEKYSEAYPKLDFLIPYLQFSKAFDFERSNAQLQVAFRVQLFFEQNYLSYRCTDEQVVRERSIVADALDIERRRAEEASRKEDEKCRIVVEKLRAELLERRADVVRCIDETRRAVELLVPRFELAEATSTTRMQRIRSDSTVHAYGALDCVTVTVPLEAPVVDVHEENEVIVASLGDCVKMLNFYEKLVRRWLSKLAKYGGRSAQELCKEMLDLKGKITAELERCRELQLPNKRRLSEGLELDFKVPDEVPAYIIERTLEKDEADAPGCSKSTSGCSVGRRQDGESEIPILSFGLDLKYWGEDDVVPAEVPRNNADCHRFWRPSDESCCTSRDSAEVYRARVITFVGPGLKATRRCRAPLKNGELCSRMDFRRCPLHGNIIDRDEMGYPIDEMKQTSGKSKNEVEDDKEFVKDVEAAAGVDLGGNVRGRKRKRQKSDSSAPAAIRERLSSKLFNRSTMKRVYATCCTSRDSAEVYRARVITFVGPGLKATRRCRAPLKNGELCSRMDFRRCPLHGNIIDRDEMGYPIEEMKHSKVLGGAGYPSFVGYGCLLLGRLSKLFNRSTMKRVYATLESIQKARAAKKFEHQFNYALSRM
ncbi:unnamed protein product [Gongylonema pulchrum]|uniref:UV-stimulated scaffold protein A n=1 Tax=Gongylonema pulchrum TaxID=637853 RepID=A0A183E3H4_9BILA|nr:unnamed protein product [Gongylonema pulchrum]